MYYPAKVRSGLNLRAFESLIFLHTNIGLIIMKMVKVLVEDTGVETLVSEKYYEKYKDQGITKILEKPAAPKKKVTRKPKPVSEEV